MTLRRTFCASTLAHIFFFFSNLIILFRFDSNCSMYDYEYDHAQAVSCIRHVKEGNKAGYE